ncbi:MAG: hypothetical protein ORN51_08280 [Akkermansiaceae bacterium]|nr:hypothetical protein [Akkermansiaceae bacterium]
MTHSFVIQPLDIQPAIAGLSLTKSEIAIVQAACAKIKSALALEAQAHPDNLRTKLHEAELHFNDSGTEEALQAFQDAARSLAGATEGFAGIQRSTAHRNEGVIDELKPIALRMADELSAKIREGANQVAAAEQSARSAFADINFEQAFDQRLQRTLDLLASDRKRIETQHAALDQLCQWGLCENPYR